MSVLIINQETRAQIAKAIARARDQAIPLEVARKAWIDDRAKPTNTLTLAERRDLAPFTIPPRSQHLQLGSYHAAISFEHQPAGLLRHLSVSAPRPGSVPNEIVMAEIAKAFGFSGFPPTGTSRIWLEEFSPGHYAINVLELEE